MISWTFAQAPWASRQTVSLDPETASASYAPPPVAVLPGASVPVPGGTGGSACHEPPVPPMVSARPPASSSHTLPSAPNPSARTVPAVTVPAATGSDTIQRVPFHHAASRLFPAASRATLPPVVAASPSTCTVSFPGSTSPADRQVPSVSVNTPATPGRVQLPAAIGFLPGPNETACTLTSPQKRPGADVASALRVVSCVHCPAAAALAVSAAWMVPFCSSARVRPDEPTAMAPGVSARPASSRPGVQFFPVSVLVASGE